jgi:hypothetical protein
MKLIETIFEVLPNTVIQVGLMHATAFEDWTLLQWISLVSSLLMAAGLLVDAEFAYTTSAGVRRIDPEVTNYLPLGGWRRLVILAHFAIFLVGYLFFATASAVVAYHTAPWLVVAVLTADLGLHHLLRAASGDYWVCSTCACCLMRGCHSDACVWLSDACVWLSGAREWQVIGFITEKHTASIFIFDIIMNTMFWAHFHACPTLRCRGPNLLGGPQHCARITLLSLLEGGVFVGLALHSSARREARDSSALLSSACVVAGALSIVALAGFLLALERSQVSTFWRHDTRRKRALRIWTEGRRDPNGDIDCGRSMFLVAYPAQSRCYLSEQALEWLVNGRAAWDADPPNWYTPEWRAKLPQWLLEAEMNRQQALVAQDPQAQPCPLLVV